MTPPRPTEGPRPADVLAIFGITGDPNAVRVGDHLERLGASSAGS